jgi:glyoxylase-like metal-dependent hydrolase (beta-lactamase superfamily II)
MRRLAVLGMLVAAGGLSIAAQAPAGPTPEVIAAMQVTKVTDRLYVLGGSGVTGPFSGGNTAVFIGEDGVTLVDTKNPGLGPTIVERVRTVTTKPIVRIINTHSHSDHAGSNGFFGKIEKIAHANARKRMDGGPGYTNAGPDVVPQRSYQDRLTIGAGADQIDLYHFGPAHTDGDTFVVFPALRTMHTGDVFAWKALPFVDDAAGGSVIGHAQVLKSAVDSVKNVTTIINGHIPVSTWNDLRQYAEFSQDFVDYAARARQAGQTVDQAAAEYKVPERFTGYTATPTPGLTVAQNMKLAYSELERRK